MLHRLFTDADAQDSALGEFLGFPEGATVADRAEAMQQFAIPISPEAGKLLYGLVRAVRPSTIVEFGLSFGISAIHLAAGLRDNGTGRLFSTELNPAKIGYAKANLERAGLTDLVTVLEGDGRETLASVSGPIQLVLLDGWPDLALPVLRLLEPELAPGATVLVDDTDMFTAELAGYLDYVRDPGNGYVSVAFPVGDGMELSTRT
jgi:predicted O-methyltransferase YrrM